MSHQFPPLWESVIPPTIISLPPDHPNESVRAKSQLDIDRLRTIIRPADPTDRVPTHTPWEGFTPSPWAGKRLLLDMLPSQHIWSRESAIYF